MGLDMYIYRCSKPRLIADNVYDRSELYGIVLSAEDLDNPKFKDLAPYCAKVRVINHYYDMKKIREDYKLSEDSYIWAYGSHGITLGDYINGRRKDVTISREDVDRKYTIDREEIRYVCDRDEEMYWRKEYDIQKFFYEHLPVENVGYYKLTRDLIEEFNREYPEDAFVAEEATDSSALFYYEWY